jgi:hypothetical protein
MPDVQEGFYFLYPTHHARAHTHVYTRTCTHTLKSPERPVKVRKWIIAHHRYTGVEHRRSNYAATYSDLINVGASLSTNFQLTTIHKEEQSYFSEEKGGLEVWLKQ